MNMPCSRPHTAQQTILVVDDEAKIVDVICSYLENSGFHAIRAGSGEEALKLFHEWQPDLVVLDLMLGDTSGEDVCRQIRSRSDTPVIMLTAKTDEASILEGLAIGADDYVTKPFSPRQLVARIQVVLRRSAQSTLKKGKSIFAGGLSIDADSREVLLQDRPVRLTPSEFKLLELMAGNPGRCFSRADLVEFAFGSEFDGYDRAIDSHIKNLRQKIETDSRQPRYIQTVFGIGYRFSGE